MSYTDKNYLLSSQYQNSNNLNARVSLHQRFGTKPQTWYHWLFDRLQLPPMARVLEVGCGSGSFWLENASRIPNSWEVTLSDFSPGMIRTAQESLRGCPHAFNFETLDVQNIPYPNESFDAVLANHMLYHVPDRQKALAEIQRVLRPGGKLYAATNGLQHMQDLWELIDAVGGESPANNPLDFLLENGEYQLAEWFSPVRVQRFENLLVVTDAGALAAYVASSLRWNKEIHLPSFLQLVEARIQLDGAVKIHTVAGVFEAVR